MDYIKSTELFLPFNKLQITENYKNYLFNKLLFAEKYLSQNKIRKLPKDLNKV